MALRRRAAQVIERVERMGAGRVFLLLFAIALLPRIAVTLATSAYTDLERFEMERTALALVQRGYLGDPYGLPTGPSAHVAPGYAVLLAGIFAAFGDGVRGEIVKQAVSMAATSAHFALLPQAAPAFGLRRGAGVAAALAGALLPFKFSVEVRGDWEAPFAALALLLLLWRAMLAFARRNFTLREALLQGLGWGAALLISPALGPVLAGVLLYALFRFGRQALPYAFAVSALALLCLAPWAYRNYVHLGSPILARSNLGLELQISNNDMAVAGEPENYRKGTYHRYHPLQNLDEARRVRELGEVAYNQSKLAEAKDWVQRNPGRFLALTAERVRLTWFPVSSVPPRDLWYALLTVLAFAGLYRLFRSCRPSAWIFTAALCLYTLLYYLVHINVRLRYPVDWILLLCAAEAALALLLAAAAPDPEYVAYSPT